ncbi:MAG: hypothetical protein O3B04_05830 [Chloroflexi bacterium]|nr:hypothetical protein [Chloroflexota bacterium]MDA1297506.1 hypothetical protein [Chloroflexota bacterium]
MDTFGSILAHHSEAVDPTLVEWIRHQIDDVVGLDAVSIVLLLGALIVLFPAGLLALVWLQRRRAARRS